MLKQHRSLLHPPSLFSLSLSFSLPPPLCHSHTHRRTLICTRIMCHLYVKQDPLHAGYTHTNTRMICWVEKESKLPPTTTTTTTPRTFSPICLSSTWSLATLRGAGGARVQGLVPGLQVYDTQTGQWQTVPPVKDALVINVGDMAQVRPAVDFCGSVTLNFCSVTSFWQ